MNFGLGMWINGRTFVWHEQDPKLNLWHQEAGRFSYIHLLNYVPSGSPSKVVPPFRINNNSFFYIFTLAVAPTLVPIYN